MKVVLGGKSKFQYHNLFVSKSKATRVESEDNEVGGGHASFQRGIGGGGGGMVPSSCRNEGNWGGEGVFPPPGGQCVEIEEGSPNSLSQNRGERRVEAGRVEGYCGAVEGKERMVKGC
jgi:hypothetical protein